MKINNLLSKSIPYFCNISLFDHISSSTSTSMDCGDVENCYNIKLKPLRVKVKRLRLDPDSLRKWKKEMENDTEVIEIREGLI